MEVALSIVRANPTVLEGLGAHLEGTFYILGRRVMKETSFCFYVLGLYFFWCLFILLCLLQARNNLFLLAG